MLRTFSFFTAWALSGAVLAQAMADQAQAIYKCRDGERVTYGDQPCRQDGGRLAVQAAPAPDPEAAARLERARAFLAEAEQARAAEALREERTLARARRDAATQRRRCDKLRLQQKWAEEDLARAGGERAAQARLKARRQQEALAVECPA
ncbi:hypothetical protein B0920_07115 [Massilia sp. KIM]|uniref:DUF4124 domain-containing protein n=1 Tax=Massilia sp. KIM TaxID=1955422 RepID=UPI0009901C79|nr:DUF4124 domain-containing protein [Massilia sp. KIM]OON63167.1 hypothetical protein B0920_07115 [Massilia sp. KIM]